MCYVTPRVNPNYSLRTKTMFTTIFALIAASVFAMYLFGWYAVPGILFFLLCGFLGNALFPVWVDN